MSARKCLLVLLTSYAAKTSKSLHSKDNLWQTPLHISHSLYMQALAGISTWKITGASMEQRPHWLGPCPFRQSCTQTRLFLACSLATADCFCKAVICLLMSTGRRLQSLAAHCWVFKNWFWMPKFLFEEGAFVALPSRRHAEAQRASCLYVRQIHLCLHIIAFFGCMLCNLTFIRALDGSILLKTG